ncbi:MAG: hypothetical protein N2511_03220 [Thermodesulfovibrionales bacterium]|nr:hypothetical protein [Thermodesulfovibrionales bacterium]
MWEYGFINENFEIVIRSQKNLYTNPSLLDELSKSIDCLTTEIKKRCLVTDDDKEGIEINQ